MNIPSYNKNKKLCYFTCIYTQFFTNNHNPIFTQQYNIDHIYISLSFYL